MRRHDVLERCKLAAEAIMELEPREWAGWIGWMMEALDSDGAKSAKEQGTTADYILSTIRTDLDTRLNTGRW